MRKLLLFFILFGACHSSFSQPGRIGAARKEFYPVKHKVTLSPISFLVLNLPVSYEYVMGRQTLGVGLAYRPSLLDKGFVGNFGNGPVAGDYRYNTFRNQLYESVTVSVNSKFYFFRRLTAHTKKDIFIDMQAFYRNWWFDNKRVNSSGGDPIPEYSGIRSEHINIYGLKALIGQSLVFNKEKKVKQVLDWYAGIGVRYKTFHFETENGTVGEVYYPNHIYTNTLWTPSFHIGLNYGIGL